jgi:CDP-4-dehydro-6-deoxyglucose reductase
MTSFRVRIEPSGHELLVDERETLLAAALRQNCVLPHSCRNGSCGSCKVRLLSGQVRYDHHAAPALSEQERAQGWALACRAQAASDLVIEVREVTATQGVVIKTLPCRVVRLARLAHDVMGIDLRIPQNERLHYLAGQYVDLLLRDGRRRSYSLANAPQDQEVLQLHVRHVPGGWFSGQVFAQMQEKDLLRFQGPFGTFFLRTDSTRPVLLMAGGTGFAPIKAIIEDVVGKGMSRPMHLYWGVRERRDLYMHDLAEEWAACLPGFRYTPVLSQGTFADTWDGRRGWVHEALLADYPDLASYEVYASGPPAMIAAARPAFERCGLPATCFFFDAFEPARDDD